MQILGHFALGYFSGTIVAKYTREKIFLPLIWFCSLLPDLDFFVPRLLIHRGPTHSIVLAVALFLPIYLVVRRGLPYFAALATHTLIGDFVNPPESLFWPISNDWFGVPNGFALYGRNLMIVEGVLFALMVGVIVVKYLRARATTGDSAQASPDDQ